MKPKREVIQILVWQRLCRGTRRVRLNPLLIRLVQPGTLYKMCAIKEEIVSHAKKYTAQQKAISPR